MADLSTNSMPESPRLVARIASSFRNPVTIKELRGRMRGRRAFAVLTLYLLVLAGIISLVYLAYVSGSSTPGSTSTRTAGKGLFVSILVVQVFLVLFIGPAFTAGAISGERERQTFDLLRTTLLSPRSFVMGKLISALSYVFLLVLASIPMQSIAFLLGGLSPAELVLSQVLILVAAVTYAMYGLWCSAVMRTTLAATVATFSGTFFVTFGIPMFFFAAALVLGPMSVSALSVAPFVETLLLYGGLIVAATNLPATLIVSEIILLEYNTLVFFTQFVGGARVWLFSPWPLFILFHAVAAGLLFVATVRRVRRTSDV